jgi:hypothetical protein
VIVFTSHVRAGEAPVLVREGFSWAALLFGALYLAVRRAWIAAGLTLAVFLLTLALCRLVHDGAPLLGLAVLQGWLCPDLLRWNLAVRGYADGPVVAAPDRDQALGRLLDARPDLLP